MFTGIIRTTGQVIHSRESPHGMRLAITANVPLSLSPGESLAVNGCCLTVAAVGDGGRMEFDLVPETLRKTTLGSWCAGDEINLEPPIPAGAPLSGHVVQGHIDGVGSAAWVGEAAADEAMVEVTPPAELIDFIMPKGSIAIDGVSLTIASVADDCFRVALIPETLQRTTLGRIARGARAVNLEVDMLAKIVVSHLRRRAGESGG